MENKKEYKIKIEQDEYNDDPRKEFDHTASMYCLHNGYDLGDEHSYDVDSLQARIKEIVSGGGAALPLYVYEHSGITMNTSGFSCEWDSGQVGYICISAEKIKEHFIVKRISKKTRDLAIELLNSEVTEYDQYLTGDVWNFSIENNDGEIIDSCCGFYGYKYCEEEANEVLKHVIKEAKKEEEQKQILDNKIKKEEIHITVSIRANESRLTGEIDFQNADNACKWINENFIKEAKKFVGE